MTGRVEVKPDVSRLLPHAVAFNDGTQQEVDVIIMATGYDYQLDFVDPKVLKVEANRVKLYKYVFPPHLPQGTLAVVGLVQAIGAVMPIAELQSRWFVAIVTGQVCLPDKAKMEKDMAEKEKDMDSRYYRSRRHTLQAFWVQYMDEVGGQLGVSPCLWRLLLTNPLLAVRCFMGPCLPAQYRLQGPHTWPHAPEFIKSVWSRYSLAFKHKAVLDSNKKAPLATKADTNRDDDVNIDVTGRRHKESVTTTTLETSLPPPPPPSYLNPAVSSMEGREKTEGLLRRCRGTGVVYVYLMLLVLACAVWLRVQVYGPKQEMADNVDL